MKPAEIVRRLRAIDHPDAQALADELVGKRGRKAEPPLTRGLKRELRSSLSDAFFAGKGPAWLLPEGYEFMVTKANGCRSAADEAAGLIVGGVGPDTVRLARTGEVEFVKRWEEHKALLCWYLGKPGERGGSTLTVNEILDELDFTRDD